MIGMIVAVALQASAAEGAAVEPALTLADVAFHASRRIGGYYPDRALQAGKTGEVKARCRIADQGVLTRCAILDLKPPENPEFGMAALKVLAMHRVDAVTKDGRPTAGRDLEITLEFRIRRGAPDITAR